MQEMLIMFFEDIIMVYLEKLQRIINITLEYRNEIQIKAGLMKKF